MLVWLPPPDYILDRGTDDVIGHIVRLVIVLCSLNCVSSVDRAMGRFQHMIKTCVGGHFGGRSVLQLHVLQTIHLNLTIFGDGNSVIFKVVLYSLYP